MLKTILIIVISVSIFGIVVFAFVRNFMKKKNRILLKGKRRKKEI